VRAFQSLPNVELAIGVDLNPGANNPNVFFGDAHTLAQFKAGTFGTLYTNVLDHLPYISRFASAAHRVLKANGTLLVDIVHAGLDHWSFHNFASKAMRASALENITQAGFDLESERPHGGISYLRALTKVNDKGSGLTQYVLVKRLA